jgi:hypothetical protein
LHALDRIVQQADSVGGSRIARGWQAHACRQNVVGIEAEFGRLHVKETAQEQAEAHQQNHAQCGLKNQR